MAGDESGDRPGAAGRLRRREGQHALADIGVDSPLGWVARGAVVLVDPPAVTQPDQQIADEQSEEIVDPLRSGDLLMTAVVPDEGDLGEGEAHHRGDEQLPPRIADEHEHDPGRGEPADRGDDAHRITAAPALEQLAITNIQHSKQQSRCPAAMGVEVVTSASLSTRFGRESAAARMADAKRHRIPISRHTTGARRERVLDTARPEGGSTVPGLARKLTDADGSTAVGPHLGKTRADPGKCRRTPANPGEIGGKA